MIERFIPREEFSSYEDFKANFQLTIPEDFNFAYDVVDVWAEKDFHKPALVWINDDFQERRLSFGEISRMSMQAANFFVSKGIKKGDFVLLILKQRIEIWTCLLALHRIGAVAIPGTYQLMAHDIEYRVNKAAVKMICTVDEPELLDNISRIQEDCPSLQHIAAVGENVPAWCIDFRKEVSRLSDAFPRPAGEAATKASDRMLGYFSSGTTGMPKLVLHNYTYPLGHIVTAKYWHQVREGELHFVCADSGWGKFGWGKIYGQWICGAVVCAYDTEGKFHPDHLLKTLEKLRPATFCAPPTVYRFLIHEDLEKHDLSFLRHCTTAGEPLNPEVYHRFEAMTGIRLFQGFGQTETTLVCADYSWFPVMPGAMGKFSPLYDADIVDSNGESCPAGVEGHIVIKNLDRYHPTGLLMGYLDEPEANRASFHDNLYDTGDTGWRDKDGYIWFMGRDDDVIKCSGYRIGPFEVESAILTHPAVLECAATAAPDPVRGQVVKATIVLAKGYDPSEELKKEIQNHVKKVTAPYKYPRIIEFVEELPKTLSGKIRRGQIREESKVLK